MVRHIPSATHHLIHHRRKTPSPPLATWWLEFLPTWNQRSVTRDSSIIYSDDLHSHTDASGIGFGAVYGELLDPRKMASPSSQRANRLQRINRYCCSLPHPGASLAWNAHVFLPDNPPMTYVWQSGSSSSSSLMSLVNYFSQLPNLNFLSH